MRSPEEGPQHLGDPGLVVGGGDEASGLEDILRGVGHREGQVPLAHHRQVVTGVAKDGGLRAINTEEALQVAHGAPLVDASNLQIRPVCAGNRVLVGIGEVGQGGLRERLDRPDDVDRDLDDRVIDLAGLDRVDDGDLVVDTLRAVIVGQNAVDEAVVGALDVGELLAAHDQAAVDPIRTRGSFADEADCLAHSGGIEGAGGDLDAYITHWNTTRRQVKLKGLTPAEYRDQALQEAA